LQGFLECPADGHGFADGFHLRGERFVGLGEFLEGPAGDFNYAIVDGRLETGWGFLGDIVSNLVECISDGELGGDFCDGKAGGLGSQG